MDENKKRKRKRDQSQERGRALYAQLRLLHAGGSEETYPINKTTRVTIEFNREKNGFQSTNGGVNEGGERARRDPRSKSPSTYAPLLFIVPNFHSERTGDSPVRQREKERKEYRERERKRKRKTEKPFSRVATVSSFSCRGERHRFHLFLFFPRR